jgi:hypothetical protein
MMISKEGGCGMMIDKRERSGWRVDETRRYSMNHRDRMSEEEVEIGKCRGPREPVQRRKIGQERKNK